MNLLALLASLAWLTVPLAPKVARGRWEKAVTVTATVDGKLARGTMRVHLPSGYDARAKGTRFPLVIALHGWGHSAATYKDKGELARYSDAFGFVVAVPDMGKTVYESAFYPETRGAWGPVPGRRWVGEAVLPYVRSHYDVFGDRAHTAIVGYSTGGRGAVMVAMAYPEFAFAGSLSGTFDLVHLAEDTGEYRIHAAVFGERSRFLERWRKDDVRVGLEGTPGTTPSTLAGLEGTDLYLAHGTSDRTVPARQTEVLCDPEFAPTIHRTCVLVSGASHDWAFWNGQSARLFGAMRDAFERSPAPTAR